MQSNEVKFFQSHQNHLAAELIFTARAYCFDSVLEAALLFCWCCCCCCICMPTDCCLCDWNIWGLIECCGIMQPEAWDSPFNSAVAILSRWTSAVRASFSAARSNYNLQQQLVQTTKQSLGSDNRKNGNRIITTKMPRHRTFRNMEIVWQDIWAGGVEGKELDCLREWVIT